MTNKLTEEQINEIFQRSSGYGRDNFQAFAKAIIEACEAGACADMFWDHDDAEICRDSVDEILNNAWESGYLEVGAEFTVRQALRLPNVTVRVTSIDEESGDIGYEGI